MTIKVFENKVSLSRAAAEEAATALRRAIKDRGRARVIAATGMAQVDFLQNLTSADGIDWQQVEMFHLDEYVGLRHPIRPAFENSCANTSSTRPG